MLYADSFTYEPRPSDVPVIIGVNVRPWPAGHGSDFGSLSVAM